ncbi:hypothetical protein [Deinococcus frigens]|uniref:hypothetical protein n=1 Tax=Deinococcus frigens TaxID=249403 RepID=UPI0004959578|nr:hypothetical protein [Deinococcus frigens]
MPHHQLDRHAAGIARLEQLHAEADCARLAAQLCQSWSRQNWSWEWRWPTLRLSVRVERVRRHA